jgi:hypothetical protein
MDIGEIKVTNLVKYLFSEALGLRQESEPRACLISVAKAVLSIIKTMKSPIKVTQFIFFIYLIY